ncbi:DUF445 domain-containing protein [Pallidibacillus pasinlerensis]|uniref:DUF445 domain-containing protein n=1 Tax=Pallidibacillus pasinlerensis TaxID=2703818 RepID=A0ABX0A1S7_9BACI|nr:DUF445 family protein [Pallidibacillus pasinlerensis]NCU16524.1 DUF445 domain-containing protein [Pallidibacillus pasinlerensis]
MEAILTIIFMAVIGAIIGGATNSLAIRMLFRPYEAKYIGKWRLPFTPGLIPKRRDELSNQLGRLVVEQLLTPETLQTKLKEGKIYSEIESFFVDKVRSFFKTEESIENILHRIGIKNVGHVAEERIVNWLQEKYGDWKSENNEKKLAELIPQSVWEKVDGKVDEATDIIISKFKVFIMSPKGYELIKQNVDRFFEGRGMFAGIIQSFLDNRNIADRIQQELVKMANNEQTKEAIQQLLQNELEQVKNWTLEETMNKFVEGNWEENVWKQIRGKLSLQKWLDRPVSSFPTDELQAKLIEVVIPECLAKGIHILSLHVGKLMERLEIEQLVKNQVDTFPTERLEELVIGLSRRELKMITYLGAYLGGIIGIVQGIIAIFLN